MDGQMKVTKESERDLEPETSVKQFDLAGTGAEQYEQSSRESYHASNDDDEIQNTIDLQQLDKLTQTKSIPYNVLEGKEKAFVIMTGAFSAIISPMSSSIYFPALDTLAKDLNVSNSLINLTVTTFLIFQGIAPSFVGTYSDVYGRRPAFLACFIIYMGANIGLALQNSYAALMVLRCVQSSGSSGTIALASAVVADITTRAERGKYIALATLGITVGPSVGPVIGGLLNHFLGWHSIFWFLEILSGVLFILIFILLPETCRAVVGNGSIPPPRWNRSLLQIWTESRKTKIPVRIDYESRTTTNRRVNPFQTVLIARRAEPFVLLFYGGLLFGGYTAVLSTLSQELSRRYSFNTIQIGLCFIPIGLGSLCSRQVFSRTLDWNFRRQAKKTGLEIVKNKNQDISNLDVEKARLQIAIPILFSASGSIIMYGWIMKFKTNLAGPVISLFLVGLTISGSLTVLNTLLLDTSRSNPATAIASANLFRCSFSAGAAAVATPLINSINIGWTATLVGFIWILFSPLLFLVQAKGLHWRQQRAEHEAAIKADKVNTEKVGSVV
ncbi:major facilitator superfamily domain-containing protein [Lipomyces oligophaga]|uniref:major facilitator superfamily domain-containing protein n=1 Tax=Lipomyces oligophaga TaxID=45792 RepID=UPI0034CD0CA1